MTPVQSAWFTEARFGLFIHWGLYSLAARHEWVMQYERMRAEEYERQYFSHFEPDLYDPHAWADLAADAGMKYFVITTKHHEGFCLWDTKLTGYKAPNTPIGRDLLRPMVDAFRQRGMRTGLYYSLLDWHHPHYPVDSMHPLRAEADREALNAAKKPQEYTQYIHAQTRELLSNYGPIDVLWYDFSYPPSPAFPETDEVGLPWAGQGSDTWASAELVQLIRELQPGIILNDRLDLDHNRLGLSVKTPEQYQPRACCTIGGQPVMWEACQTFSGSWGYHRDEHTWRSAEQVILTLVDCVSKGGNLLLNVGPTARGEFDYRVVESLKTIGRWMRYNGRSIYGCTKSPAEFACPEDCRITYSPSTKRLYVHVLAWPYKHLHLNGRAYRERVAYAQLLHDASELRARPTGAVQEHASLNTGFDADNTLTLELPQITPRLTHPVIELYLK